VVLTQVDLLPAFRGFDLAALRESLARVMPEPRLQPLSAETGEGLQAWLDWLGDAAGARPTPAGERPAALSPS